jgi:hypothetical protein
VLCSGIRKRQAAICVISGFRFGVNTYAVFWDVTKRSLVVTDVSGQNIGLIFKVWFCLCCFTLECKTDTLSRNVGKSKLRNVPEEGRSQTAICSKTLLHIYQTTRCHPRRLQSSFSQPWKRHYLARTRRFDLRWSSLLYQSQNLRTEYSCEKWKVYAEEEII